MYCHTKIKSVLLKKRGHLFSALRQNEEMWAREVRNSRQEGEGEETTTCCSLLETSLTVLTLILYVFVSCRKESLKDFLKSNLYGSVYIAFSKWQHFRDGERISGCPGLEVGQTVLSVFALCILKLSVCVTEHLGILLILPSLWNGLLYPWPYLLSVINRAVASLL